MIKTFCAFAGYGGSEFALKQAGIESECVGFSEIDKYAIKCFEQNFPNVKNYGSITDINWKEVPDFDLITGGFPCQDVSVAGKQDLNKGRSILGLELTKALVKKQPKWFLFENVKGLMSKKFEEFRSMLIKSWESAGYVVAYKVLNSKDFGIPQNRERVWFVGVRKDIYEPFKFQFPNPEPLNLLLKDILEDEVDEKYFLSQKAIDGFIRNHKDKFNEKLELANTINSVYYKMGRQGASNILKVGALRKFGSGGQIVNKEGITNTLNSSMGTGGNNVPCILDLYNHKAKEDVCPTLTEPHHNNLRLLEEHRIRKLTPKECFRLMGFFNDEINLEGLSDTQKYRLAGNGWALRPASDILKNLIKGE